MDTESGRQSPLRMVWAWETERCFDQSNWKVDLPFPKKKRSKLGEGRWDMGTHLAIPGEMAGRQVEV